MIHDHQHMICLSLNVGLFQDAPNSDTLGYYIKKTLSVDEHFKNAYRIFLILLNKTTRKLKICIKKILPFSLLKVFTRDYNWDKNSRSFTIRHKVWILLSSAVTRKQKLVKRKQETESWLTFCTKTINIEWKCTRNGMQYRSFP